MNSRSGFLVAVLYFIGTLRSASCLDFPYSEITKVLSFVAQEKETLNHAKNTKPVSSWVKEMVISGLKSKNDKDISRSRVRDVSAYQKSFDKSNANDSKSDPDVNRNLTELITSHGYPSERFTIQTQDGFLLDLHHIPHGRQRMEQSRLNSSSAAHKSIVFLQHGLLCSACDWVINSWNDSLGFILADAGYDVWMGNSRGNTYSRRHIKYSPEESAFWDWSFDEMAKYDTTAFIDFILNKTGQSSLHYIGHSQGTSMALALFSQRPEYQRKVRLFVALAPVTNPTHAVSPLHYMSKIPDELLYFIFGHRDFLPNNVFVKFIVNAFCKEKTTRWICDSILLFIIGPDTSNLKQSRLVVYLSHTPAGASVKSLIHYSQLSRESKFMMYNFGSAKANIKHYGLASPPVYNLTNIYVPIVLFSGSKDWLATEKDVRKLKSELVNVKSLKVIAGWDHLDFTWAKDAADKCYRDILTWLAKY